MLALLLGEKSQAVMVFFNMKMSVQPEAIDNVGTRQPKEEDSTNHIIKISKHPIWWSWGQMDVVTG